MFWTNMEELHFLTTLIDFSDCTRTLESKYHKKISASRQVEWIKHKPFNRRNSGKFSITVHQKQCQEYWSQIQSDLIFQIMHFLLGFWLSILKMQPCAQEISKNIFWWFCVCLLPQYWQTELTQTKRGADKNLSARLHFNNFACLYQMEVF